MQTPHLRALPAACLAAFLVWTDAALAQPAPAAASLASCRAISNAGARLACYDALPLGAAAGQTAAAATAAAGALAPAAVPAPGAARAAPTAPAGFGLERPLAAAGEAVTTRFDGDFEGWGPTTRIRLANGQVWQVADGSSAALYLRSPRVTVKRAPLGGYVMEFEGSNRTAKVRRLE